MAPESLTNEQLLRAIIEAQVKGGFDMYSPFFDGDRKTRIEIGNYVKTGVSLITGGYSSAHILEILLDSEGCEAAYGDDVYTCKNCAVVGEKPHKGWEWRCLNKQCVDPKAGFFIRWCVVSQMILMGWHEDDGNNVRAALETAYSFLPKS